MKKSDMIKLLEQHLTEDRLDFLTDDPIVVARDILNFLESKGMRPPKEKVTHNYISHTHSFIVETWEKE